MPVLNSGGDVDYITSMQLAGRLAPFLIVATASSNEQNLAATFVCVVNMPIVAAAWLKGYVTNNNLVERAYSDSSGQRNIVHRRHFLRPLGRR